MDSCECVIVFNKITFDYLDGKFGEKWRSKIKKEILQLNNKPEAGGAKSMLGQFSVEDTTIMAKAINLFRKNFTTNYWLIGKSYDNKYRERPKFVEAALKKLQTIKKLSPNSRLEIIEATKSFKNAELPEYSHALKVEINSDVIDLLNGVYEMSSVSGTDVNSSEKKNFKTKEEAEKAKLDFYKDYYRLEEVQAIEVSEPFFDRLAANAIVITTVYKHRIAETHLLLFKKYAGKWQNSESHICARLSR